MQSAEPRCITGDRAGDSIPGFQGGQRDDTPLWSRANPQGFDCGRLAFRPAGARAVLRQGGVRNRRVWQSGYIDGKIDGDGNIFEGPRKREYPMPPLRSTGFIDLMRAAARTLRGYPFPGPAAINSEAHQDRSACMYHGFCNRGGCHVEAKNSTAVNTIPKALATGRLKLLTRVHVTTLEVDNEGRVSGVNDLTDGTEYFQPAKVVLLASYVYENVRLLLLSRSKPYRNGLSNNHGQVGKHYFSHNQGASVTALFPWNLNNWYGLPAQGVGR
jgi:gluconate 2-dehydrogenase alpha chain